MTTTTTTSGARRGRRRGGGAKAFLVFFLGVTLLASPSPSISSTIPTVDEIDGSGGSSSSSSSSSFEKHPTTDILDQVDGTTQLRITSEQPTDSLLLSPHMDLSKFQISGLGHPSRGEVSVSSLGEHTATYLTNFAGGNTYPSGWQRPMYSISKGICYVDG